MDDEFDDIRFYNDVEIPAVLKRIPKSRWLVRGLRREILPSCPALLEPALDLIVRNYLSIRLGSIHGIDQFQRKIIGKIVLPWILKHTTNGLSVSGLEYLQKDRPYTYISNHRDIVLDSALLNYVLGSNELKMAAIAFGDNLMINELVTDIIRANKSFIVKRNLPFKQRIKGSDKLSRYIWSLHQQGESVWIAQREGRAKDGDDRTNPSVVKMLYMSQRKGGMSFTHFIRDSGIVPVAASYEKDPCDLLKAREMHKRATHDGYEKKEVDDLLSIYIGLRGDKGRFHIAFGEPLQAEYKNEQEVAKDIDRTIHSICKLWPTNYIAYDELKRVKEYSSMYSNEERTDFLNRFQHEKADIRLKALAMYAQPVLNKRALDRNRD